MKARNTVRQTVGFATTGFREMPSNAVWAASKALRLFPAPPRPRSASGIGSVKRGGRARRVESVKGSGGVDSRQLWAFKEGPAVGGAVGELLRKADIAAEQARQAEERAVELAQTAKSAADQAVRTGEEMSQRVAAVKREAERAKTARIERARREEAELVGQALRAHEEEVRRARHRGQSVVEREKSAADKQTSQMIERATHEADERVRAARLYAKETKQRAEQAIESAKEALGHSRDLASEASRLAREVATEATREADRLAEESRNRAAYAHEGNGQTRVAGQTSGIASPSNGREGSSRPGAGGHRTVARSSTPKAVAHLDLLTKEELLALAHRLDLESRSSLKKQELVRLISKSDRVDPAMLTKGELLRIATGLELEANTAMTKDELISVLRGAV